MILILKWDPPSVNPVIQLTHTQTRLLTGPLQLPTQPLTAGCGSPPIWSIRAGFCKGIFLWLWRPCSRYWSMLCTVLFVSWQYILPKHVQISTPGFSSITRSGTGIKTFTIAFQCDPITTGGDFWRFCRLKSLVCGAWCIGISGLESLSSNRRARLI